MSVASIEYLQKHALLAPETPETTTILDIERIRNLPKFHF